MMQSNRAERERSGREQVTQGVTDQTSKDINWEGNDNWHWASQFFFPCSHSHPRCAGAQMYPNCGVRVQRYLVLHPTHFGRPG
jgi:hypothetical protein